MKLYHSPMAPNPERVSMFLKEKGKWGSFAIEEVNLIAGEHRTPEFTAKSPLRQSPCLELDDGRFMTESRAICTYFEALWPEPPLMGTTPEEKGFIEMWDRRVELMLFVPTAMWVRHGHPALAALETQNPEFAQQNEKRARKMFEWFDQRLGESPYIAGDAFSIADITAYATAGFARLMQFRASELPNWGRWLAEMKARPLAQ